MGDDELVVGESGSVGAIRYDYPTGEVTVSPTGAGGADVIEGVGAGVDVAGDSKGGGDGGGAGY